MSKKIYCINGLTKPKISTPRCTCTSRSQTFWISRWNRNRSWNILVCFSGTQINSNHENNTGRKSRETLTLRRLSRKRPLYFLAFKNFSSMNSFWVPDCCVSCFHKWLRIHTLHTGHESPFSKCRLCLELKWLKKLHNSVIFNWNLFMFDLWF